MSGVSTGKYIGGSSQLGAYMANLNQEQLRRLARLGAMARLEQLRQEEAAIRAEFPELFGRGRASGTGAVKAAGAGGRTRRRRKMSAAGRKAVSDRMRKYWAERRKAKASK
jgi:hypothetical protein